MCIDSCSIRAQALLRVAKGGFTALALKIAFFFFYSTFNLTLVDRVKLDIGVIGLPRDPRMPKLSSFTRSLSPVCIRSVEFSNTKAALDCFTRAEIVKHEAQA